MDLQNSFVVPADIDTAWRTLLDVEAIAPCMPGATLETVDGDAFTGSVKVKLGPVNMTYGGKAMVGAMLDEFTADVAVGQGDALTAVAVAYGVASEDRAAFATLAHNNFSVLFPSENVTADEVTASLEALMKSDANLAKYVI